MAHRVLSIFHPDNEISQVFQNHAFFNANLEMERKYINILPVPRYHHYEENSQNHQTLLDVTFNKISLMHQYNAFPFQYRFGYQIGKPNLKLKMGFDYLSDNSLESNSSITSVDCDTEKDNNSLVLSHTLNWEDWKLGSQMKYYFPIHQSITNLKWQTAPLQTYRLVSGKVPLGYWIANNWQYRGEIRNLEGVIEKINRRSSQLPSIINNSILYQPEDWLILHVGLSYLPLRNGIDLIIGSSVNLENGVNVSYQYQNQKSVFDLFIKQIVLTYQVNHEKNTDSVGVKYSLQY